MRVTDRSRPRSMWPATTPLEWRRRIRYIGGELRPPVRTGSESCRRSGSLPALDHGAHDRGIRTSQRSCRPHSRTDRRSHRRMRCACVVARIGGGAGSGIAGPQSAGHGLAGVREETQQRMKAEAAFVSGRGPFHFRVGGDQRGVEVQDQAGTFSSAGLDGGYALVCPGRSTAGRWAWRRPVRIPRPGPAARPDPPSPHRETGGRPTWIVPGATRWQRPERSGAGRWSDRWHRQDPPANVRPCA